MVDEPERVASVGKDGPQVRRARADGWTARKREKFLDHYAATGNAAEACRHAAMAEGAAYRLRRRDPEFAQQYEEAHAVAKARLEELLIQFARTSGRMEPVEPGEIPPLDPENFDPELAIKVLRHARPSRDGNASGVGARPRAATTAELVKAIKKLLAMVAKRRARLGLQ